MPDINREGMRRHKDSATEDRRVKKTKSTLRACLFDLLENKKLSAVTVKELTEMADINRSTFYFYYKDIYDMMEQIQDEIYDVFLHEIIMQKCDFESIDQYVIYVQRFLDFCKDNFAECKFVISNDCNNILAEKIKKALLENVPDSADFFDKSDARYYLTTYCISAIQGTILQWMQDGMQTNTAQLARFLSNTYFEGARLEKAKDPKTVI